MDDFALPASLGLAVRTVQLVLLVTVLEAVIELAWINEDCGYDGILAYLAVSVLISLLLIGVGMATIYLGLKGTLAESEKREPVKTCLLIYGALFVCEFACAVVGIVVIYDHLYSTSCEGDNLLDRGMMTMVSCVVIMQVVFDSIVSCCVTPRTIAKLTINSSGPWWRMQMPSPCGCCV